MESRQIWWYRQRSGPCLFIGSIRLLVLSHDAKTVSTRYEVGDAHGWCIGSASDGELLFQCEKDLRHACHTGEA